MTVSAPAPAGSATVDTVVFDIGNVLIEWDPNHLYRQLIEDEARRAWFLSVVLPPEWNLMQDAGRTWEEAVAEALARHPEEEALIRAYRQRWHEMIPGEISGTVAILDRIRRAGVPNYAITNFAADTFAEAKIRFPFLAGFIDTVVSGDERLLKPDPRIYRVLADRNGLDLTRCVFIDDSPKNVEGARSVGMTAIHFVGPEDLERRLADLGLLEVERA